MHSSRTSSQSRDRTCISYVSRTGGWVLYVSHLGSLCLLVPVIAIQFQANPLILDKLVARWQFTRPNKALLGVNLRSISFPFSVLPQGLATSP